MISLSSLFTETCLLFSSEAFLIFNQSNNYYNFHSITSSIINLLFFRSPESQSRETKCNLSNIFNNHTYLHLPSHTANHTSCYFPHALQSTNKSIRASKLRKTPSYDTFTSSVDGCNYINSLAVRGPVSKLRAQRSDCVDRRRARIKRATGPAVEPLVHRAHIA